MKKFSAFASPTRGKLQLSVPILFICLVVTISEIAKLHAASVPYSEDFNSYAAGDTPVTNFSEIATSEWTIAGIAGSGDYHNVLTTPSGGTAAGAGSSSTISFPSLATSGFSMSTTLKLDSFSVVGSDPANFISVGLAALASDALTAATGSRYEAFYVLDPDGSTLGQSAGSLMLQEFGGPDSNPNVVSASTLPISLGSIYTMTFSGVYSGPNLILTAALSGTAGSIVVTGTDSTAPLTGTNFGYIDIVKRVGSTASASVDVHFDNFTASVPEPGEIWMLVAGAAGLFGWRSRRQFPVAANLRNRDNRDRL